MGTLVPAVIVPDGDVGNPNMILEKVEMADRYIFAAIDGSRARPANAGIFRSHGCKIEYLYEQPSAAS